MRIAPRFNAGTKGRLFQVPKGLPNSGAFQPSLRDLCPWASIPSVETLGYCRLSLRDSHTAGPKS